MILMSHETENNTAAVEAVEEKKRESIDITPENAKFYRSGGGLVSLEIKYDDGEETIERISLVRAFPVSNPDEYISVRKPASARDDGGEVGMIRDIHLFDADTVALLNEELDRRYFIPEITKIMSVKDKFGYLYFDSVTSAGKVAFTMTNPYSNFRKLENGSVLITDVDGNCFRITDPEKLDRGSYKKIEIYL